MPKCSVLLVPNPLLRWVKEAGEEVYLVVEEEALRSFEVVCWVQ